MTVFVYEKILPVRLAPDNLLSSKEAAEHTQHYLIRMEYEETRQNCRFMSKLQKWNIYQFKEMSIHPLQAQKMRLISGNYAVIIFQIKIFS